MMDQQHLVGLTAYGFVYTERDRPFLAVNAVILMLVVPLLGLLTIFNGTASTITIQSLVSLFGVLQYIKWLYFDWEPDENG